MVIDYNQMKEKFEQIELKIKSIEKAQENFVNQNQLENQSKNVTDEIIEKLNLETNKITDRIKNVEKSKIDTTECLAKFAGFAPIKALEKFNQTIFEIKTEIERNIEHKFNDQISTLKFKIDNSIKEDDVHELLDGYASKLDLANATVDFDKFDFSTKGKKLKKFVEQCIKDYEEDEALNSSDASSDYDSELEDDYDVGTSNIVEK